MHKVSISSMRVLQMLQLLFEKSYTMNELMDAMSELTGEACTNFLISKSIKSYKKIEHKSVKNITCKINTSTVSA